MEEKDQQPQEFRELPLEYKNRGIVFKQLKRNDKAAIYKSDMDTYEVFPIIVKQASEVAFAGGESTIIPAREHVPTDNEFGKNSFCYQTEEAAMVKFNKLSA
jgi:hypothetical protein